jgi:GNAT superfamily N-acetyltransferase
MTTHNGIVARRAELTEIFQVRWDVLRPNRPREAACFPGDQAPETIHVGAFEGDRNVGCATATRVDWQGEPAWQLRGMGITREMQGRGVGRVLLATLEELVAAAAPIRLMWCNAREEAVGFYEKQGWMVASERFLIEDVGPHFKMTRQLRA